MNKPKPVFVPIANISDLSLIEHIEIIAKFGHDSEFSKDFLETIQPHTAIVAEHYDITEIQALFFSILVTINLQTSSIDLAELANFFNVNCITLAKYLPDIKQLINKQLVRATAEENRKRRRQTNLNAEEYYVNRDAYEALLKGNKFVPESCKAADIFDMMKIIRQMINNKEEYLNDADIFVELNALVKQNQHIQFLNDLKVYNLDDNAMLIYLFLCSLFLNEPEEEIELMRAIHFLFPDVRNSIKIRKQFMNLEHPLQHHDLLAIEKGSFKLDSSISLTDKSISLLVGEDKNMFIRTKMPTNKQFNIIKAEDIIEKHLFYSEDEQKEIDFIIDTLKPENYQSLMKRLADEGLPTGLCILFYGEAGTSKTMLTYSLAKKTGRDIFDFKLSEGKSMYYGESQKLIKKAFDYYREMVEKSKVAPIFLLNEADALLNKRSAGDNLNHSVQHTDNELVTILLNEFESLNGVLIATTNLENQFDNSFYRRFLIKKKFEKPNAEVRKKIWADKIPWLDQHELDELSKMEVTGAIIENAQRKILLQQALYGIERPDLDLILNYLEEENLGKTQNRNRIGFIK